MLFSTITATASLLACAHALATHATVEAEPLPSPLAKRSTEGVHLVNCRAISYVDFCNNDSNCNFPPSASNKCDPIGGIVQWEGGVTKCQFSTGVTFTWFIQSDAQSQPNFSKVGTATNGFENFDIFKDDKHVMFTEDGFGCQSIYYALPGSTFAVSTIR